MGTLNKELLDVLACPKCKARVAEGDRTLRCSNPDCGLVYPVRDGIPVMLIEEATDPHQETVTR